MTLKVQPVLRSLLLGLVMLAIILVSERVGAIAPFGTALPKKISAGSDLPALIQLKQAEQPEIKPGSPLDVPFASPIAPPIYSPRQETVAVDPTNYGERFTTDVYGRPVTNEFIVVLHETVGSASSAINTFRTRHLRDDDQVSYHSLIKRDGTVVYLVPPEMRAFGAGNSVFDGPNGPETVKTNAALPPSVNNFAYHTSLESPSDGRGNGSRHSGYTEAQYQSLAWIVARTNVSDSRITTHRAVDRSGTRRDPRSFDSQRFFTLLQTYPRANSSSTGNS